MNLKVVTTSLLDDLSRRAAASPRRRANHNLHPELADPVQRFLNAIEPGSYIRPHRHVAPNDKWELFVILSGAVAILLFDDTGTVTERVELDAAGPNRAIEIPPGAWHALAATQAGTVMFEFKQGPYAAISDKDFAAWAPAEADPQAVAMAGRFARAAVGERLAIG